MEIRFLGVGEACDPLYPNTSLLVTSRRGHRFLLDCGFTIPHRFFAGDREKADDLDGIWISHFHGDHFFGIPLLILRFWEMGRTKSLFIAGPGGVAGKVHRAMELAYPGFLARVQYALEFQEMEPGRPVSFADTVWQVEENIHSQRCLALRLDDGSHSLFYSGDGRPTGKTMTLAKGVDMVIHEAFLVKGETGGHGNVTGALEFAAGAGVKRLALVHLQRDCRRRQRDEILELLDRAACEAFLPEPDTVVTLDRSAGVPSSAD